MNNNISKMMKTLEKDIMAINKLNILNGIVTYFIFFMKIKDIVEI